MKKKRKSRMQLLFIKKRKPNKPNIFKTKINKGFCHSKIAKLKKTSLKIDYRNSKSEYRKQKLKNSEDKSMRLHEKT